MSDDTNQVSGGEAVADDSKPTPTPEPAKTSKPAPKSDAEVQAQEAEGKPEGQTPEPSDEDKAKAAKAEEEKSERKKNRTREYINRINRENAEYRERLAALEARQQQPSASRSAPEAPADGEPTLEQFDFDVVAFQRAHSRWAVQQELTTYQKQAQQAEQSRKQQEIMATYSERIADFTDEHPDFQEVVGSIPFPLSGELQAAIMAHPNGPQIAYHLGNNDDDAFALASIQPHLAAAAVERLASRLTAAPATQAPTPTQPPRPVSQAPAPVPTVSGRSPTETPPEKMTDDEWFRREKAKRKRA